MYRKFGNKKQNMEKYVSETVFSITAKSWPCSSQRADKKIAGIKSQSLAFQC